jgi:uncharacterized protein YkwD
LSSVTRALAVLSLAVFVLLALPVASALACADAQAPPGTVSNRAYSRALECLVNEQRAGAGLGALDHDRRLARAARRFSSSMVRERFFDHVSPEGSTLGTRAQAAGYSGGALGETIGWGAGVLGTPEAIVRAWMESPPHHAILMSGGFQRIGLGVASARRPFCSRRPAPGARSCPHARRHRPAGADRHPERRPCDRPQAPHA